MNISDISPYKDQEGSGFKVFRLINNKLRSSDQDFYFQRGVVTKSSYGPGFHILRTATECRKYIKYNVGNYWIGNEYVPRGYRDQRHYILSCLIIRVGFSKFKVAKANFGEGVNEVILAEEIYVPTEEEVLLFSKKSVVREEDQAVETSKPVMVTI